MQMKGILGTKIAMTQIFNANGLLIPVTVLKVEPNLVLQTKTTGDKDGYNATVLAYGKGNKRTATKAHLGQFNKVKADPRRKIQEIREMSDHKAGDLITASSLFKAGEIVDVEGVTKGGGRGGSSAQHVFKGKKMSGHYGTDNVTVENLQIVEIDEVQNTILIKGSVPGAYGSIVTIKKAEKNNGKIKEVKLVDLQVELKRNRFFEEAKHLGVQINNDTPLAEMEAAIIQGRKDYELRKENEAKPKSSEETQTNEETVAKLEEVLKDSSKPEIALAFKEIFGIKPLSVNIINSKPARVRTGTKRPGFSAFVKKAIITLPKDMKFNLTGDEQMAAMAEEPSTIESSPSNHQGERIMAIISKKPRAKTSGIRQTTGIDYKKVLTTQKPTKSLTSAQVAGGGRNNRGVITVRHRGGAQRRKYRIIDFLRNKDNIPASVKSVEYDPNRSCFISLIAYKDGTRSYIIAPKGIKLGDTVISGKEGIDIKTGNTTILANIPEGTFVHNVELFPGKGGQMSRAAGTSAQILGKDESGAYVIVRLTSSEVRKLDKNCRATIGVVSNEDHGLVVIGKAGRNRHRGIRPTVRGSAMNPNDHPHGGGEGRQPIGKDAPRTP
ncbi:unnamed protein product [Didymodactylos carnosus]|uniref:Large ribosomal subunit protein uL2 n=1 Tax=Didymodactylos carnosus TaxID=1234261 RepID=A0A8S2GLN2_9BILA|nr:unnamed protein product [Didymodactylos carnosus]CAF3532386.1 unnamed protein product [Didymodactylos carnosus]